MKAKPKPCGCKSEPHQTLAFTWHPCAKHNVARSTDQRPGRCACGKMLVGRRTHLDATGWWHTGPSCFAGPE